MDSLRLTNLAEFYRGRRVLITGDTGFKGSWLAHWLLELGAEVTGLALAPEPDSNFALTKLESKYKSHRVDIRNGENVLRVFSECKPELVFHMAAQALVRLSYDDPAATYETNVMGTLHVMDAVRKTESVRSFVNVTSDKCYKNKEWHYGYRENDELGGYDPYSSSKACAEILFESYRQSFFSGNPKLGVASVRAGNVVGGGDFAKDRIIPDIVRAIQAGEQPELRNPNSTRPWQHVLEPLGGYLLLAKKLFHAPAQFTGAWNFGPTSNSVKTVEDLTRAFLKVWGSGSYLKSNSDASRHEAKLLHLSIDKARTELGWVPAWDFDATVTQTAQWYKDISDGLNPTQTIIKQIHTYMETWK
jgi:CDP-glucose 4,6-dehydratase